MCTFKKSPVLHCNNSSRTLKNKGLQGVKKNNYSDLVIFFGSAALNTVYQALFQRNPDVFRRVVNATLKRIKLFASSQTLNTFLNLPWYGLLK
jgi:hypothetical protein